LDGTLAQALCERPLALAEQGFRELLAAELASPELLAAAQARRANARTGAVAVIPIFGAISQRDSLFSFLTGGTSVDQVRANLRAALADDSVSGIVLEIDSPGGMVDGIDELAAEIRRSPKPIVAHANSAALSAAYWLGASADEIGVTPSGAVGSVGIWTAHQDVSKAAEKAGITTTLISAGRKKVQGNPWSPLSDEARASLQEQADTFYAMFTRSVAAGRGVSVETVRGASYGEGDVVLAQKALKAGMVDRVETLDQAITRVARGEVMPRRQAPLAMAASDTDAGPGSGLPFSERLPLVAAEVRGLVEHARERADMRAKEGRSLSAADRQALLDLAGSLSDIAYPEAPASEPIPTPVTKAWPAHALLRAELVRADLGI
jgi:signal peptide peptidase SppA